MPRTASLTTERPRLPSCAITPMELFQGQRHGQLSSVEKTRLRRVIKKDTKLSMMTGYNPQFPYQHLVPRAPTANAQYRLWARDIGFHNEAMKFTLWRMCARDILFWINTFGMLYETRPVGKVLPFTTFPFQDDHFGEMKKAFGFQDIGIHKSRDQGWTWMMLYKLAHGFVFLPLQSYMMVSRNEDAVDKRDDTDALMWKLQFLLNKLPAWMRPTFVHTHLHLKNEGNGSVIDGASTTGNISRGGRRGAILLDEFAAFKEIEGYEALSATQAATNCRIFLSTPQGASGAFYDVMHMAHLNICRIRSHWSNHPLKNRGMYDSENGRVRLLEKTYTFPKGFKFKADGRLRSPWYDLQCARAPHDLFVRREHDINYSGSVETFYDPPELNKIRDRDCRDPQSQYAIYRGERQEWVTKRQPNGELKFWCVLDEYGNPPSKTTYVMGVDVSMGTGASNSAIVVVDRNTRTQVAEFASNKVEPQEFAELAAFVGRLFCGEDDDGCHVIWESNGPGRTFGSTLIRANYGNIYLSRNEKTLGRKVSDIPGWFPSQDAKLDMHTAFKRGLTDGSYVIRSAIAVDECRNFILHPTGKIEYRTSSGGLASAGPKLHGDIATAHALAWWVIRHRKPPNSGKRKAPANSVKGFMDAIEKEDKVTEQYPWG